MKSSKPSLLGAYGPWIDALASSKKREFSFLDERWKDVAAWSGKAREFFASKIRAEEIALPLVEVTDRRVHDGLVVEELAWRLPYGPATRAWFLKPEMASGRLPAVLALHDHGANKYFGKRKIADAGTGTHPHVENYRSLYYGGRPWANELARRGYGVLVHDVFPFESRRILASDIPGFVVERTMLSPGEVRELTPEMVESGKMCTECDVSDAETLAEIDRYNAFAGQYETTVAKSLFCAGLTWPGVALAEDRVALDYLSSRPDVDPGRIGCGGLSGGGMRTNFLAGSDSRIRCSVTTGFMTTWADFAMESAYTHTWMIYIPGLPPSMDYPDILAMRTPLPSLVQSTRQDPLYNQVEVRRAEAVLAATYEKAGAAERFRMTYHEGPHRFDVVMQEEAFSWFDRWLRSP